MKSCRHLLPRDATQSAVMPHAQYVVCPSVCLSVRSWRSGTWSHRSEYFENNFTVD